MRPPEEVKLDLVSQWLNKAEDDYLVCQHLISEKGLFLSAIGFHAQQAAEKYLKAYLVERQIDFPKTHNLGILLDLIALADPNLAACLNGTTALNPYGVDFRYPGDFPVISIDDARKALDLAGQVREAIKSVLKS
jgi:HEPN domain-containing protein